MKKLFVTLLCVLCALTLVGCTSKVEEPVEEVKEPVAATGTYTVYNMTGALVTELYLYEAGAAEKGENLAGEGLKNTKSVTLTYEGTEETVLCLEFNYEGGEAQKFETLHIEEAPITLKSVDEAAGATAIAFAQPEGTGHYAITNNTGADVTELYMYAEGSEDKGTNYAETAIANGASYDLEFNGKYGVNYVLEWVAGSDEARNFPTLHIEDASIELLSIDAAAGATNIKFGW